MDVDPVEERVDSSVHRSFYFEDGSKADDELSLLRILEKMDDETFSKYVNDSKNDIAAWIKESLGNDQLGSKLQLLSRKESFIKIINMDLERKGVHLDDHKVEKIPEEKVVQESGPIENALNSISAVVDKEEGREHVEVEELKLPDVVYEDTLDHGHLEELNSLNKELDDHFGDMFDEQPQELPHEDLQDALESTLNGIKTDVDVKRPDDDEIFEEDVPKETPPEVIEESTQEVVQDPKKDVVEEETPHEMVEEAKNLKKHSKKEGRLSNLFSKLKKKKIPVEEHKLDLNENDFSAKMEQTVIEDSKKKEVENELDEIEKEIADGKEPSDEVMGRIAKLKEDLAVEVKEEAVDHNERIAKMKENLSKTKEPVIVPEEKEVVEEPVKAEEPVIVPEEKEVVEEPVKAEEPVIVPEEKEVVEEPVKAEEPKVEVPIDEQKEDIKISDEKSSSSETDMDRVFEIVKTKGKISAKEIAERFNLPRQKVEEWGHILEEYGLIKLHYPIFGSVVFMKAEKKEEEKLE